MEINLDGYFIVNLFYVYEINTFRITSVRNPPQRRLLLYSSPYPVTIKAADSSQPPLQNQKEFAQYINALLGYNAEHASASLKQFVRDNRLSILNAAEEVTLLLTTPTPANDAGSSNEFKIGGEFLQNLGFNAKNVHCKNMVGKSQYEIEQFLSQQSQNNKIHIIEGS